jgi:hypothetical protein
MSEWMLAGSGTPSDDRDQHTCEHGRTAADCTERDHIEPTTLPGTPEADDVCPRCNGRGREMNAEVQIGAPSCLACFGSGKKENPMTASNECSQPHPDGGAPCCRPIGHQVLTEHWNGTDSWPHQPDPALPGTPEADERVPAPPGADPAWYTRTGNFDTYTLRRRLDPGHPAHDAFQAAADEIERLRAPVDGRDLDALHEAIEQTMDPDLAGRLRALEDTLTARPSPVLDVRKLPEVRVPRARWDAFVERWDTPGATYQDLCAAGAVRIVARCC